MTTQTFGAEFWLDNGAGTLTKLGEVIDVGRPRKSRTALDATHHGSTDATREFIKSKVKNLETFTVQLRYDPGGTTEAAAEAAVDNDEAVSYKSVFPTQSGDTWEYGGEGLVLDWEPGSAPIEGLFEGTLTIQPTGPFTSEATS
jgi:hypothetical protein